MRKARRPCAWARPGGLPSPEFASGFVARLRTQPNAVVSGLARNGDGGGFVTYVGVPIVRGGSLRGGLYIVVPATGWLRFLQSYPLSDGATLSLIDGDGAIIARTLGNDVWVGSRVSPEFVQAAGRRDESSFRSTSLEGEALYTASSRSRLAGWVLTTGVPSAAVEATLRTSAAFTAASVGAAAGIVMLFAWGMGRRIINSFTDLATAARAVASDAGEGSGEPLPIDEAETVRLALGDASRQLLARERARDAALARAAEARAEAEQSNAAKDEFLAMLGHELRNPLSAIKSASALLAMPKARPAVHERSREVIERQVRRLTDLVDDLLDVARLNSGKIVIEPQPVELAKVAADVLASFRDAARCVHLKVTTDLRSAPVDGDETRLEQIVANLFDNACKYTMPGGSVRIETATVGGEAVLTITDSGSGIGSDLMPHLFEAFAQGARTLARAEGGLGLGLAVVKRLVELHGGRIDAESAGPDRGTTFRVALPLGHGASASVEPEPERAPAGLRVVLVDDNRDNSELLGTLLLLRGHEVAATEADGLDGLAAIERERPDIAIVDIGLPGIDGFEVARRVRSGPLADRVRLFALTGYGLPEDRARAEAAGFDGFLVKPFDIETFERELAAGGASATAVSV